jgi:hypothetical protein
MEDSSTHRPGFCDRNLAQCHRSRSRRSDACRDCTHATRSAGHDLRGWHLVARGSSDYLDLHCDGALRAGTTRNSSAWSSDHHLISGAAGGAGRRVIVCPGLRSARGCFDPLDGMGFEVTVAGQLHFYPGTLPYGRRTGLERHPRGNDRAHCHVRCASCGSASKARGTGFRVSRCKPVRRGSS